MNLTQFVRQFTDEDLFAVRDIVFIGYNLYLAKDDLKKVASSQKRSAFAVGAFLGVQQRDKFYPSFQLLDMILPLAKKKVVLNDKSAWLFICGRDVLKQGVVQAPENLNPGDQVIVISQTGDCLGLGEWANEQKLSVKRILDRGDFLRRER